MADPRPIRNGSVSSAGTTNSANLSFVPRYTPHPEPAYISSAAASEHVTHRHRHENYDLLSPAASPTNDGAVFSDSALSLLNTFLDSLLYNFLAKARGTNLNHLRPAILEVLKPRLGREALASADEELQGLVGDGDSDSEDQFDSNFGSSSTSPDWHLESAFKRMRLRVMVFIRLGDFDDEDEERYMEDDSEQPIDFGFQSSPAPVYLASVLEYIAEQTLSMAGDAAYTRAISRTRRSLPAKSQDETRELDEVTVEDKDVEKIALNPALGRLWRTWLKSYRGTITASPLRGYPRRSSISSPTHDLARNSGLFSDTNSHTIQEERETPIREYPNPHDNIPEGEPNETDIAANIPLPIAKQDVDEIEVPGLAKVIYDDDDDFEDDEEWEEVQRPRGVSFIESASFTQPFFSTQPEETEPSSDVEPIVSRPRSNSVPHPAVMPWGWVPLHVQKTLEKVAKYNEELLAHATNVPLPLRENDVTSIGSKTPDLNDSEGFVTPVDSPAVDRKEFDEKRVSSQSSKTSLIAGATALVAGAAAIATATLRGGSKNGEYRRSLDVQTKEVFDPEDTEPESKRTSKEEAAPVGPKEKFVQGPIIKEPASQVIAKELVSVEPKQKLVQEPTIKEPASKVIVEEPISTVKPKEVESKSIAQDEVKPQDRLIKEKKLAGEKRVAEARRMFENRRLADEKDATETSKMARELSSKATSGVYKPKSVANSQFISSDKPTTQSSLIAPSFPPRNDSRNLVDTSSVRGGLFNSKRVPERESSKPALNIPAVSAPIDSPIKSASSTATREAEEESPISPVEEETLLAAQPQKRASPTNIGPPKPSTTAANPYAMLYDDDVEPELIGVAKTSNVPIHAATPTMPSEQRPWTPNRGASSVTISSSITDKPTAGKPNAEIPTMEKLSPSSNDKQTAFSPSLRSIGQEADTSPIVTKTLVVNDGNPLNAERFQNYNRAKESPTLPRFFAQATTPTESEHRRGSLAQSISSNKHSPKGSQGSTGNQNKREEEAAREKKFEALLGNDGPVKYTLTPEEIRDSTVSVTHPSNVLALSLVEKETLEFMSCGILTNLSVSLTQNHLNVKFQVQLTPKAQERQVQESNLLRFSESPSRLLLQSVL
jgi:hypothetical protein